VKRASGQLGMARAQVQLEPVDNLWITVYNECDGQRPSRNSAEAMTDNALTLWDRTWPFACLTALALVNTLWLVFLSYELLSLVYGWT